MRWGLVECSVVVFLIALAVIVALTLAGVLIEQLVR